MRRLATWPDPVVALSAIARLADGAAVAIELRIPPESRAAGGPIEFRVVGPRIDLTGLSIDWLVRTSRGWAHFRGVGRLGGGALVPFRCSLLAAAGSGELGPDRIALRLYAPGADPELDGPIEKLVTTLPAGSVRLRS